MYICYLDESGVPEPAQTSHFVLLGLAIPAETWRDKDREITELKFKHRLGTTELHAAWMARKYPEQRRIQDFEELGETDRRKAVLAERRVDLATAAARSVKAGRELAKNYRKTDPYIHLTHAERLAALKDIADRVSSWTDSAIFADAQKKAASKPGTAGNTIFNFAFEQVVSRFDKFLLQTGEEFGLLVQDRNDTAADRLTYLMRKFHKEGTTWSNISRIVETPLFVDSELTSMVQLADLCSFATRRFFENGEADLFDRIYARFHRNKGRLVGLRHYTGPQLCACQPCTEHGRV